MSHFFKKTLKISEDIINLHLCTKNFDMIYSSWDKEHDGLKTDWRTVLLPKTPKNQNVEKKKKKYRRQYHFTQVYQKSQSYDVWFLRYGVRKTGLFVILGNFMPFYLPITIQKIKTIKKILKKCAINKDHNHLMYRSWHIRCNRPNFLSFWVIFCPFTFDHPENQNFEIKKTPKDIIILHMCTINDNQMMYVSWDMQCYGHNFLSFWAIFVFLYHSNP